MTDRRTSANKRVAVIIPSYKVSQHVIGVIERVGDDVERIYVVDDKCPEASGEFVRQANIDPRVVVLEKPVNEGVGGAVITGYKAAIRDGMEILVKIDGDGQMDPALISQLIAPIVGGSADYTKGNRFFSPEALQGMPLTRLFGNAGLSFLTKISSGYWDILDPTNGFTAIHAKVADVIPFEKVAKRYFFESDMLFRLNTVRAVVADIPMFSVYGSEKSSLRPGRMLFPFLVKNLKNAWKRVIYSYFLRGFSFASFCLFFGWLFFGFGLVFGLTEWIANSASGEATPTGTVMISVVPLILGFQLLMGFVAADIASVPTRALHGTLAVQAAKALKPYANRAGAPSRESEHTV